MPSLGNVASYITEQGVAGIKERRESDLTDLQFQQMRQKAQQDAAAQQSLGSYLGGPLGQLAAQSPEMAFKAADLQSKQAESKFKLQAFEAERRIQSVDQLAGIASAFASNPSTELYQKFSQLALSLDPSLKVPTYEYALNNPGKVAAEAQALSGLSQQLKYQLETRKASGDAELLSPQAEAQKTRIALASRPPHAPPAQSDLGKLFREQSQYRPGSPEWSQYQRAISSIAKPKDKDFEHEAKLRTGFEGQAKAYLETRDARNRVKASAINPSAAGDLALIFNYMKVLDPGSVVRESEFAQAAATGSFGDRIKAAVERVVSGQRLDASMRDDFIDRTEKLFNAQSRSYNLLKREYGGVAQRSGLDQRNVTLNYEGDTNSNLNEVKTDVSGVLLNTEQKKELEMLRSSQ